VIVILGIADYTPCLQQNATLLYCECFPRWSNLHF